MLNSKSLATIRSLKDSAAASLRSYSTRLEGEFIQNSKVPTFHYQPSLPRLPIPKLEESCERYINAVAPLITPSELETTKKAVDALKNSEGVQLQKILEASDKANPHTSFISAPWFDMYLASRVPLISNFNPFISFQDDPNAANQQQGNRATQFIISSVRFLNSLSRGNLAPDVYHLNEAKSNTNLVKTLSRLAPSSLSWYVAYMFNAYPLDMSQYGRLFASTRIPKEGKDELVTYDRTKVGHVTILRKGHIWRLDVRGADGKILPAASIRAGLESILKDATPAAEHPIASLTALNRNAWAKYRASLVAASERNKEALQELDSGLFVISLDEEAPQEATQVSRSFLIGNGSNRWFDKSFSLLMHSDGRAAINFEHAWGDGVAVLRYFNDVHADTLAASPIDSFAKATPAHAKRLQFDIPADVKEGIARANREFAALNKSLDIQTMEYLGFGKNQIKKYKLSPDGIIQMAFQMAYYRQYGGKTVATYESCSTAAFRHGRTETIRSASLDSVELCKAFNNPSSSNSERIAALRKAVATHAELTKNAATGKGFDRHLFALRYIAEKQKLPMPAIFQDKAYGVLNHNILSTSTLASPALLVGGFGPVVEDGYGLGYMVDDDRVGTHITSFHKDTAQFCESIKESVIDIQKELEKAPLPEKK